MGIDTQRKCKCKGRNIPVHIICIECKAQNVQPYISYTTLLKYLKICFKKTIISYFGIGRMNYFLTGLIVKS